MVWFVFLAFAGGLFFYSLIETQDQRSNIYEVEEGNLPSQLHPTVEKKKDELIERAAEKNIDVVITDGLRTIEEQEEIYERGRSAKGNVVSYAKGGESYHNYGLAIDFALRTDAGDIVWDLERDDNENGKADWMEVADTAKELGFEWGGDWSSFKDYPHLQMDFGLSIRQLQNGKRPRVDPIEN
ncbi:M15 family metallopeptidase [Halobacillus sp. Marseille-Q1614]|uniref:M15 family metallopeptidase n=1 Tax=Halobacillus sp. Marseille-Q1614 TaxID=2709134 RepID=UPI00156FC898|nr:M15 family metallopeptidase [Halobacillus sp. Marseille-Q1614]